MKRFLSLLLCAALALGLCACADTSAQQPSTTVQTEPATPTLPKNPLEITQSQYTVAPEG